MLIGAVVVYPALGLVAALCAYPAKWGPAVLVLVGILRKLRVRLLVLGVFRRYLGRVVLVLLQEGIEVVLVVLAGRGQVWAGPLALVPLLRRLQTVGLWR